MSGDSEHPVTVGDLRVYVMRGYDRPATIADLVSALRAEGVLAIERDASQLFSLEVVNRFEVIDWTNEAGRITSKWETYKYQVAFDIQDQGRTLKVFLIPLDALAEAQPFPPAGVADRPILDSITGVDPSEYSLEINAERLLVTPDDDNPPAGGVS